MKIVLLLHFCLLKIWIFANKIQTLTHDVTKGNKDETDEEFPKQC